MYEPFIVARFREGDEAGGIDLHITHAPGSVPLDVGAEWVLGGIDREQFPFEVILRVVPRPYPGGSWSEWPKRVWPPRRLTWKMRRWMRRCWVELDRQKAKEEI